MTQGSPLLRQPGQSYSAMAKDVLVTNGQCRPATPVSQRFMPEMKLKPARCSIITPLGTPVEPEV